MRCRSYLALLVGLGISGIVGCATLPALPTGASGETAKRVPKPSTLVAYGELHEKAAAEPGRAPADQEDLRTKARLAYQQALQINPNELSALMALGRLYASDGDYERAVATFNRALGLHPKNAEVRYELGMCHGRFKSWDLALQNLQKAVEMDPENHHYATAYGLCLARAQRYDESFAVLAKVEGAANAYYDLARMLHHLDQDQAAKEHLHLALAQNPQHMGAQQLLTGLETGSTIQETSFFAGPEALPSTTAAPAALGRPVRVVQP